MYFTVTIYDNIISKFQKNCQKFKNSLMVKKSTRQMNDFILDACIKFQNYSIKIVGGNAFYSHYRYYNIISKFQKIAKKSKMVLLSKKHKSNE